MVRRRMGARCWSRCISGSLRRSSIRRDLREGIQPASLRSRCNRYELNETMPVTVPTPAPSAGRHQFFSIGHDAASAGPRALHRTQVPSVRPRNDGRPAFELLLNHRARRGSAGMGSSVSRLCGNLRARKLWHQYFSLIQTEWRNQYQRFYISGLTEPTATGLRIRRAAG